MSAHERYVIRKKIAEGGMAEVFLATQEGADGFSRPVVLKRVRRAFSAHPLFGQMLVDEAHIAMTLHHGNIVPVLDLAKRDGWYFLVMELVDGWDLRKLLARSAQAGFPLPRGLALHVTAEVCRGLAYAHAATSASGKSLGIVHRDISPQNVLLSEHGEVRVADFGVAKALGKRTRTEAGVIKGNVDYMSPEQATGEDVDASSDVFSTGAVLYQLVTGQMPFPGANELETLQRVQKGKFTPLEEAAPDLPPELAAIVKKALQLRPADRFRTAKEMMDEIEEYQRRDFPAPGKSELAAWLAELSRRDGDLPASKRAGMPMDDATIILGPGDILSAQEVEASSPVPPPPMPPPVPAPAPQVAPTPPRASTTPRAESAPALTARLPPRGLGMKGRLLGGAVTAVTIVVAILTIARTRPATEEASRSPPLPPAPVEPAASPPASPAVPAPPARAEVTSEPIRRAAATKLSTRTTRQKSKAKARQKSAVSRKKQAKARRTAR